MQTQVVDLNYVIKIFTLLFTIVIVVINHEKCVIVFVSYKDHVNYCMYYWA